MHFRWRGNRAAGAGGAFPSMISGEAAVPEERFKRFHDAAEATGKARSEVKC